MALTLFSTAAVTLVAAAGLTALRMTPSMYCPHRIHVSTPEPFKRYVFIGDIHGSSVGLREILHGAGLLAVEDHSEENYDYSQMRCQRSNSSLSLQTMVVQLGDIVDRGRNASSAWDCLDELQQTSPGGSVMRLVGNHEIDWIQGNYRGSRDTPEYRRELTSRIRTAVLNQNIIGALALFEGQVLVTHAGLRQAMYDYIMNAECSVNDDNDDVSNSCEINESGVRKGRDELPTAAFIAETIQAKLVKAVASCPEKHSLITSSFYRPICPELRNPIFGAGPERGGAGVGGPFWTDFSVISNIVEDSEVAKFTQIVGHTAANCDVSIDPKCQPIRATKYAIASDAAIYWGNRAYLEALVQPGVDGSAMVSFASYTKQNGLWLARNLTHGRKCGRPLVRQRNPSSMPWAKAQRVIKNWMHNQ